MRNTVSRRLRHCLASVLADLPAGTVVVVRALPASAHVPTLCEEVSRGVTRAMRLVGQRGGTTPVMPS